MPANGRWDLIRRLKVNVNWKCIYVYLVIRFMQVLVEFVRTIYFNSTNALLPFPQYEGVSSLSVCHSMNRFQNQQNSN